jgi:hypothetical protein
MQIPLLACALLLQNPAPPPLPGAKPAPAPVAAPPEKPLVPGAIPEGAGPEERVLWQQLCRAALPPNTTRVPLTGFDLVLDAQIRNATNQSNEAQSLRYRFQVPDRVRAMTEHGKELLHGPKGDFILDPARKEVVPLAVGREGEQDRRQLSEIQDLARNFLALSDPAALRIAELKLGSVDPQLLPEKLRASATGLVWLEILSPDFRLQGASGMVRVKLGLRRDKGLPDLCLVGPDKPGPGAAPTTLIQALDYREKQGLVVPHQLALYSFDEPGRRFQPQPALEVWLKRESDLRPNFAPATFEPEPR